MKKDKEIKSYKSLKKNFFLNFFLIFYQKKMLFFFAKKSEEISVERSKFFCKFFFRKSFKVWVSLIEKHYVDKKSKHLKKNIIFQIF